jgi:hypothetical protein
VLSAVMTVYSQSLVCEVSSRCVWKAYHESSTFFASLELAVSCMRDCYLSLLWQVPGLPPPKIIGLRSYFLQVQDAALHLGSSFYISSRSELTMRLRGPDKEGD